MAARLSKCIPKILIPDLASSNEVAAPNPLDAPRITALRINPNGRLTKPQDVAKIITMIANHSTPWMTGNIIRVDGGEDITG